MGRIAFEALTEVPVYRKIAFGSWRTAGDPSVYGVIEIDVSKAQKFIQNQSENTGVKLTYTHLVGRAIALVLRERPEINGMIRLGKIYRRQSIDVFFQVNVPGTGVEQDKVKSANLAGTVIRGVDHLNVIEIARSLREKAELLRESKDIEFNRAVGLFKRLPWFLSHCLLNLSSFLNYDLNLNVSFLGIPRDPFGSVMITNVGGFGIEQAWAPLVPYSRVPFLLTICAVRDKAWVVDGKVEVKPILTIGVTFDHRFMDGVHAGVMARKFKECFEDPEKFFL